MKEYFNWRLQDREQDHGQAVANFAAAHEILPAIKQMADHVQLRPAHSFGADEQRLWELYDLHLEKQQDPGVDAREFVSWFQDPKFAQYVHLVYAWILDMPNTVTVDMVSRHGLFDLIPVDPATAKVRFMIQKPGQIMPLHIDSPKHREFDHDSHGDIYTRYLIFLEDQERGQGFQIDQQWLTWCAGDIFTWNHDATPHASCNVGYHDRYTIQITGIDTRSSG